MAVAEDVGDVSCRPVQISSAGSVGCFMRRAILLIVLALGSVALAGGRARHNVKPKGGYVPDAKTAIAIAVAVWGPIYGEDQIAKEKPYQARLTKGVWTVEGSLPEGWLGGVALAEIAEDNGRVLRVSHGK
jgi:hypothetical protein